MTYVFLVLGLLMLFYGGDKLVDGSVAVARKLGLSPLLIGLTLVGFGTSTPELLTSLLAAFKGSSDISVGNVVGSNIANILLVLGVAAVIKPVKVDSMSFKRDAVFLAISTLMILVGLDFGLVGRVLGILMVFLLVFYVCYSYQTDKKHQKEVLKGMDIPQVDKKDSLLKELGITILGLFLTMLGAKLLVDNSIILAKEWGISEAIIGLTIVAVGTSLPELATSIVSSIKGHNDVAFGNVVGSNIYNALFILGITGVVLPIKVASQMTFDILLMTLITLILILIALKFHQFSRRTGWLFLLFYALYVFYLGMNA